MSVIYLLLTISIVVALVFFAAFIISVRSGQYDDMEGPAHRILNDDDDPLLPDAKAQQKAGDAK